MAFGHQILPISQLQSAGPAGVQVFINRKLHNITRQRTKYIIPALRFALPEKQRFLRPKIKRARVLPFARRLATNRYPYAPQTQGGQVNPSTYFIPRKIGNTRRVYRYPTVSSAAISLPLAGIGISANLVLTTRRKLRLRPRALYIYPYFAGKPTMFPRSRNIRPKIKRKLRLRPFAVKLFPYPPPPPPLEWRLGPRPLWPRAKIKRRRFITRQKIYAFTPPIPPATPQATIPVIYRGGTGYGSRTRGWRIASLSRDEMDVLLANMTAEDRHAALLEIDDDDVAFMLENLDSGEE
jgi:hypothetical protein